MFSLRVCLLLALYAGGQYAKYNGLYTMSVPLQLLIKVLPILQLALEAFRNISSTPTDRRTRLIGYGLLLCMPGDIFMDFAEMDSKIGFILGMLFFLLGHVWYIRAFLVDTTAVAPGSLVFWAAFSAWGIWFLSSGIPDDLFLPVCVYIIAISTMCYRATAVMTCGSKVSSARNRWIGLAGAVVFAISDLTIGIDKFRYRLERPHRQLLVMSTYYLAQSLISASTTQPTLKKKM